MSHDRHEEGARGGEEEEDGTCLLVENRKAEQQHSRKLGDYVPKPLKPELILERIRER